MTVRQGLMTFSKALGLFAILISCTQQNWSPSAKTSISSTQDAIPKASDRPTETGAGVPGYLVNCSILADRAAVDVYVACGLVDAESQPVPASGNDAWSRYSLTPPAAAPQSLQVKKMPSDQPQSFDVLFELSGAERSILVDVALDARYSYQDPAGAVINSKPLTSSQGTAVVAPIPPSGQECKEGVLQDGICFFLTARSCDNACDQLGSKPHAAVVDRFGMGSTSNAEACRAMYQQLKGVSSVRFGTITTMFGLGCHQAPTGAVLFDQGTTHLGTYPALGGNRLCGCQ